MATIRTAIQFDVDSADHQRLQDLPWSIPLEGWDEAGVPLLLVRRGESRHPVIFVERQGQRYAIKETTPHMAEREIRNLIEIEAGLAAFEREGAFSERLQPALAVPVSGAVGIEDQNGADSIFS